MKKYHKRQKEKNIIDRLRNVILPQEVSKECFTKVVDYLDTIGFFEDKFTP